MMFDDDDDDDDDDDGDDDDVVLVPLFCLPLLPPLPLLPLPLPLLLLVAVVLLIFSGMANGTAKGPTPAIISATTTLLRRLLLRAPLLLLATLVLATLVPLTWSYLAARALMMSTNRWCSIYNIIGEMSQGLIMKIISTLQ